MQVGYSSSTESKPCVNCGKSTATYKLYEQSNIQIRVPLCDTQERQCIFNVDLKFISDIAIKLIKREVK